MYKVGLVPELLAPKHLEAEKSVNLQQLWKSQIISQYINPKYTHFSVHWDIQEYTMPDKLVSKQAV